MSTIIKLQIDGKTRSYNLDAYDKDVITFGRGDDCDIDIPKPYVSRLHGCFYYEDDSWNFRDLESVNGIFYKGTRTQSGDIHEGDVIILSKTVYDTDKIVMRVVFQEEIGTDKLTSIDFEKMSRSIRNPAQPIGKPASSAASRLKRARVSDPVDNYYDDLDDDDDIDFSAVLARSSSSGSGILTSGLNSDSTSNSSSGSSSGSSSSSSGESSDSSSNSSSRSSSSTSSSKSASGSNTSSARSSSSNSSKNTSNRPATQKSNPPKKSKAGVFVVIALLVVIGVVVLFFAKRKPKNDNTDSAVTADNESTASTEMASTEEVTEVQTTEAETAEEAAVEETTESEEETVTPSEAEAVGDAGSETTAEVADTSAETEESYYDENQMLTSAGALAGTKNYFYKLNPEMKSVDTDASWTITNENVEDEAHAGCAEIEYKASDSDNDSRTYYYVNKESGDVTIEEYISGKRIKSVETFNAKDEISE